MTGSLYLHIPFCAKRCPYCHFYTVKTHKALISTYMRALHQEWLLKKPRVQSFTSIESIYLGGGTPSQLPIPHLKEILSWFQDLPLDSNFECTIEVNPEDASLSLFQQYKSLGINRVSIGVQSLHSPLLQIIGREHTAKKARDTTHLAYAAGIKNITIDLMYDLPGQTVEDFAKTVQAIQDLPITHLSLYNLTIEEKTPFYKVKEQLKKQLPSEEASLAMLDLAIETLPSYGLERYEISAFAKKGYEAKHNSRYWKGEDFLGLGPSAFSYYEGKRFQNHANMKRYSQDLEKGLEPIGYSEKLSYPRNVQELIAIRLRLLEGFSLSSYKFPTSLQETLLQLKHDGLVALKGDHIQLTEKGAYFYDSVAEAIV